MGVSANRREFHSTGWEVHSIGWEFHSLLPFSGLFLAVDGQKIVRTEVGQGIFEQQVDGCKIFIVALGVIIRAVF